MVRREKQSDAVTAPRDTLLPPPVTVTDAYLAAILAELRKLNARGEQ